MGNRRDKVAKASKSLWRLMDGDEDSDEDDAVCSFSRNATGWLQITDRIVDAAVVRLIDRSDAYMRYLYCMIRSITRLRHTLMWIVK